MKIVIWDIDVQWPETYVQITTQLDGKTARLRIVIRGKSREF